MKDKDMLTEEDVDKDVINSSGDQVGQIVSVEDGTAQIDPDPGLTESIRSKLGWGDDEENFQLDDSNVDIVSDNEIHLSR